MEEKEEKKKINIWFNLAQNVQYDGDFVVKSVAKLEMLLDKDPSVCGDADFFFNRTVKKKINYLNHPLRHKPNYYNGCRHGEGVEDLNSPLANKLNK